MPITPEELANLTPEQTRDLLTALSTHLAQLEQQATSETETLRGGITEAITDLDALIGDGDPKGLDSIVAVRQYTGDEMAQHAKLALPLAFHALEILARATRDVARVVGT